jgi:Carbohydrate esterase, sialic acid-specific acetylesterase
MRYLYLAIIIVLASTLPVKAGQIGQHLFILSGQSNMEGLDPEISFVPEVEKAFGKGNVIVVKDAHGGEPIRRWYKKWKPFNGDAPEPTTWDHFDRLMGKVSKAIKDRKIQSVTVIWMQGEQDAREKHGDVYKASLGGLIDQFKEYLGRDDINFVIGRLSDFDMDDEKYFDWTTVREAQVAFAESYPRGSWVNTDDLNDGINKRGEKITNDLHYSVKGYKLLGERFAEKAIARIKNGPHRAINSDNK